MKDSLGGAPARWALWALLAATMAGVTLVALRARGPVPELPVLASLPEFSLRNRDGRVVTGADLRGEPWIAGFIFTRCRGVCPLITERMVRLGEESNALPRRVSISVDPEFDSPEVLAEYGRGRGADDPRWLFLTGERAAVHALVRQGFLLAVDPDGSTNPDEPIVHSTRLVLVDAEGRMRGTYDSFDDDAMAALRRDARRLQR